ncbi:vascular endothelial growth factor receptor kdr-like [Copidosoma floridanum]|uniref:vascular endothelial growth factor receptor kdr-like n=1 Tax=Copidosoma floridanum TaxID=29053 RepID=UPI000C6FB555|nr:vascular endothelial growth factor receptor kdr-like [Copidosoma floridanum]
MSNTRGCHGLKPQLYPNVTELEINEGELLNITCTSNSYVNFYFPTSDKRGRTTSKPLITPEVRSTHKTFIRLSTVFGDTGWYGCADESKQITSLTYKNYSDLSISWVYVYVFGLSEKITFDSKTGFVIKGANWDTTSTSRKVSNTVRVEEKGIHNLVNLVTSELIIDNVTYDDRGNYSCKIRSSFDEEKSRDTYVCVFDTNKPYINLTSDNLYVVSEDGKSVTFLAFVDACPIPTLEWTHPQGYIIRPHSWKVIMSYYGTMSRLTLSNIDKYATGTFTLRAKHDKIVKELKFYLEVYGKPAVEFDKTYLQSYYSFNKTAKFVCLANRYPESNISWIVTETLIYNKLHNLQRIKTDVQNSNFKQKSTVELKQLVTSGTIKCKACNIYGCASASKEIQLTDGVANASFGIIQPNRSFQKGDNISLICAAVINDFSIVEWYDDNRQVVVSSERIHVTSKVTEFTYQAILTINNASQSDRRKYYCKGTNRYYGYVGYPSRKILTESYFLNINDPPTFTLVNLNTTERTVMARDFENPLTLLCHVWGIPTPNITWSKNNVPLKSSSQYTFEDGNQKLVIRYFFEKDAGNYSCHAKNDYGTVEQSQIIVVKEKETKYKIVNDFSVVLSGSNPSNETSIYCSEDRTFVGSMEFSDDFDDDDSQPGWRSNYKGDYENEDVAFLCTEDLFLWAYQVANGMEYLSQRKVLHCDLAARNILLAENNIIKICDFGLAKTLYKDQNYKKQHEGKFPVKWMAIESIRDGVFSTMSDVWSFGVVLWELFTLAEIPYLGIGFEEMYQRLVRGYRMAQPTYATDAM